MKIVKTLAIAYLLWAILYSLTAGRSWVADALAFKLNGGPQLVSQLEGAGYNKIFGSVDPRNKWLALTFSRPDLPYGHFVHVMYYWGSDSARKATEKPKSVDPFAPKRSKFIKTRNNWAIKIDISKEVRVNPARERIFIKGVQINPSKLNWHPISEARFLFWMNRGGGPPPELEGVIPLLLLFGVLDLLFVQPISLFWAFAFAFSPSHMAQLTAYLLVLIYGFLILLLMRGLLKK